MAERSKGLSALVATFALTGLLTALKNFESGHAEILWLLWTAWSWNHFAYAFDKRMLPWQFIELKGGIEGSPKTRTAFFWGTLVIYLLFLILIALAN